ncbi:glycosyltransferase [Mycolicibacterium sediminis]|uniref:Glycosyl transferase n=1 Tax=Mycolicibacterium sediminis TaxID=1286180 RepID=A0A7I7QNK0_9MYCO|nr:glycosyltransferase [Mycolicibacterium sediminis]BBY27979.1 glycosyl transferase [Mycolicibacterium sediminis]
MRVGLVGANPVVEPAQRDGSTAAMAAAMAARGADVTVYAPRHDAEAPETLEVDGFRVVQMPQTVGAGASDLAGVLNDFARFLVDRWSTERPDVVHAGSWIHGVAAQLSADRHSIPTVQALPELGATLTRRQSRVVGPPARTRLERLLARTATRVAAACSEDVEDLIRMGCARSRIAVLPQGVDVDAFAPTGPVADRKVDQENGFRIVAAVDHFLPHHGLDDLIRVIAKLPAAELVIVGGPVFDGLEHDPEAARLQRLAVDEGVSGRVRLTGALPVDERAALLRSADVFACASWYEPTNPALLEAMACGVPVVATEAGAAGDVVIHDVTGLMVPPRNSPKLFAALTAMLHGGLLREGMGLAGRARARSCYGWDRVASETENALQRAVDAHAARPATRSTVGAR